MKLIRQDQVNIKGQDDPGTLKHCERPGNDLYIYLVEGRVGESDEGILGGSFMGNWVEEGDNFLFFSRPADEEIQKLRQIHPELVILDKYDFSYEQWQGLIPERLRLGRFIISPPWVDDATEAGLISLILDPGLVFGNGLHPTTKHCLEAVCLAYKENRFENVIDFGTGTGVLAIAAALLGAETALAVDINPLCVKTAKRNVKLNGLGRKVKVIEASAEEFRSERSDLVLANLHYEVLIKLIEDETFRQDRAYILSGLMRSDSRQVLSLVQRYGFEVLGQWDYEMTWFTIFFN